MKNTYDMYHRVRLAEKKRLLTLIKDLKLLFKGLVLISNIVPVITGFWLSLYFSGETLGTHWIDMVLTISGSTFLMAGALTLNNWYDADIDAVMERTKKRPTVTGAIPLTIVLALGVFLSILGQILLLFTTIEASIYAFVGWFTYVVLYTMWTKRRYTLNTVVGSISGAVTPLIGWATIQSATHIVPIILFLIIFIWQIPHTLAIAIRKVDEYKAAGVAILPVVHGISITKRQMLIYIACLTPLPFFLISLGVTFVITAVLLQIGWLVLAVKGLFIDANQRWAKQMFLYSVNYLMILFFVMVLVTLL